MAIQYSNQDFDEQQARRIALHDRLTRNLPIVADSWEQLRRCDVERLLDSIGYDDQDQVADAADLIKAKRPDLTKQTDQAAAFVAEELGLSPAAKQRINAKIKHAMWKRAELNGEY